MSVAPVLRVEGLRVTLGGGVELVRGVSFAIARGEIFALVGESGSGKSLTALAVMRLLPEPLVIAGGGVELGGDDLFACSERSMNRERGRRVAMIFQEPQSSLNPVLTIEQQLFEVLRLHRGMRLQQARPRMLALLEEVGIPDPAARLSWYPHQLSGGQKQRIMIAMALACEPALLIADEPTTALDVTIQKQVLDLLKRLCRKRDLAVLLITHDMGVVAEMADRVAVMRSGAIVEEAAAAAFFRDPQHPYSRELIGALPDPDHFLPALPAGEGAPVLEVTNLKVWFPLRKGLLQRVTGYTRAVDGVDIALQQGETLALVGESGCGKTTTGMAILGFNPLREGTIRFRGQPLNGLSRAAYLPFRKEIQVIFQDPFSSMNPRMTVQDIIEEGMVSLGVESDPARRRQRVLELLLRVGLEGDHRHRYPHEFSGGQRQRIAIARALAVKPSVIVCDEPTSALDVSIRCQVLDLLRQLQDEEGLSYLFITHDLSLIAHIAHRVAVMRDGRIVEQGAAAAVLRQPRHDYTRTLLAAAPRLPPHP